MQNLFAGAGIKSAPALADGVLVAFAGAQMDRNHRRPDILATFLDESPKEGVPFDLVEEHPDRGVWILSPHELDGLGGLPDIGRGGRRHHDGEVRRTYCC